jgi:hypothetical protein
LRAGGDAQLGEAPVEVRADGARGQEQPFADLPVGQAARRQPDDLLLLRGERGQRIRCRGLGVDARGPQFTLDAVEPRPGSEAAEDLVRRGQPWPGLGDPTAAAQPFPVVEQHLGAFERPLRSARIAERLLEVDLGVVGVQQRPAAVQRGPTEVGRGLSLGVADLLGGFDP